MLGKKFYLRTRTVSQDQNIEPTADVQSNTGSLLSSVVDVPLQENASAEQGEQPTGDAVGHPIEPAFSQTTPDKQAMEVHHPHHVTHKKNWREYLLEFFMLFLAVFLGFVAENIRESSVEKHEEREYVTSMVNDLKTDTAKLGSIIREYEELLKGQDSILKDFDHIRQFYNPLFQRNFPSITHFPQFHYTDGTIQQLMNSGGLRLLHDRQVVDSILSYDAAVKSALLNQAYLFEVLKQLHNTRFDFYNYRVIDSIERNGGKNPDRLLTKKDADTEKFYTDIRHYNGLLKVVRDHMLFLREKAMSTLSYVQQQYHLEKE